MKINYRWKIDKKACGRRLILKTHNSNSSSSNTVIHKFSKRWHWKYWDLKPMDQFVVFCLNNELSVSHDSLFTKLMSICVCACMDSNCSSLWLDHQMIRNNILGILLLLLLLLLRISLSLLLNLLWMCKIIFTFKFTHLNLLLVE